jgi:hypothetical protein
VKRRHRSVSVDVAHHPTNRPRRAPRRVEGLVRGDGTVNRSVSIDVAHHPTNRPRRAPGRLRRASDLARGRPVGPVGRPALRTPGFCCGTRNRSRVQGNAGPGQPPIGRREAGLLQCGQRRPAADRPRSAAYGLRLARPRTRECGGTGQPARGWGEGAAACEPAPAEDAACAVGRPTIWGRRRGAGAPRAGSPGCAPGDRYDRPR